MVLEYPVEVDNVNPPEALVAEDPGLGGRVVVEHGGLVHVAAQEPYALAIFEVNRRVQDQELPPGAVAMDLV